MDKNTIKQQLSISLKDIPAVFSVYLFGSMIAGTEREQSDVDIAVFLDENLSTDQMFDMRLRLMDIFDIFSERDVDIVLLNNASLKMIHQVLSHGELIFDSDPEATLAFRMNKQKEYFDFKYYIDKDIHQMKNYFHEPAEDK